MNLAKDALNRVEQVPPMPSLSHKVAAPKTLRNAVERERRLGRIFTQQSSRQ